MDDDPGEYERFEAMLATRALPVERDAVSLQRWRRHLRIQQLLTMSFRRHDCDEVYRGITAARSSSQRERIAVAIGRRSGRPMGPAKRGSELRNWRWRFGTLTAASLIVLVVYLAPATRPEPGPRLVSLGTGATIDRGSHRNVAQLGESLESNDLLATPTGGTEVVYADASRVRLEAGTRLTISNIGQGKILTLRAGGFSANIAPQPTDRPLRIRTPDGRAVVLGTRFTMRVGPVGTTLSVEQGSVRLSDDSTSSSIVVGNGQHGLVSFGLSPALEPDQVAGAPAPVRILPGQNDPRQWSVSMSLGLATMQVDTSDRTPENRQQCLRLMSTLTDAAHGKSWGAATFPATIGVSERSFCFRLRVDAADPGSTLYIHAHDLERHFQLARWPIATCHEWKDFLVPLPTEGRETILKDLLHVGIWNQSTVISVSFVVMGGSTTLSLEQIGFR